MNQSAEALFENIYDKYSPMIFGILLEISPSKTEAETVLIITFEKIYLENHYQKNTHSLFLTIVTLAVRIAFERFELKEPVVFKSLGDCPLLNKIIFESINIEDYCEQFKLNRLEAAKVLRNELNQIRLVQVSPFPIANNNSNKEKSFKKHFVNIAKTFRTAKFSCSSLLASVRADRFN